MNSVVRPLGPAAYAQPTAAQPNNRSHWGHYQAFPKALNLISVCPH